MDHRGRLRHAEETHTQVEVGFTDALDAEGLVDAVAARLENGLADPHTDDEARPCRITARR